MGNGFIVEISNSTNAVQEVNLFSGTLPDGVVVESMNYQYDFIQLKKAAQVNPFIGNTLTTQSHEAIQIEINQNKISEKILLKERYEGSNIIIEGQDNYIKITCPPNAKFYIRLNSITPEVI